MNKVLTQILYNSKAPLLIRLNHSMAIPVIRNILIFSFLVLINVYQFFVLSELIDIHFYFVLTLLPCLMFVPLLWSVVHEAIHQTFHPNPRVNYIFGRIIAIFMGPAFDLQKRDHLKHHVYNSTLKDSSQTGYWKDLFRTLVRCHFSKNVKLSIKQDSWILLFIILISMGLYRHHAVFFLLGYFLRGQILEMLDSYAHSNTPMNDVLFAKNVRLPKYLEKYLFMNFNYHGLHHLFPTVSWYYLPEYRNYYAPDFYFISHGGFFRALKEKYICNFST